MIEIDWEKFAQKAPIGTRARDSQWGRDFAQRMGSLFTDGITMSDTRDFYSPHDFIPEIRVQSFQQLREEKVSVVVLEYLIDGQWRTFDEVMT